MGGGATRLILHAVCAVKTMDDVLGGDGGGEATAKRVSTKMGLDDAFSELGWGDDAWWKPCRMLRLACFSVVSFFASGTVRLTACTCMRVHV